MLRNIKDKLVHKGRHSNVSFTDLLNMNTHLKKDYIKRIQQHIDETEKEMKVSKESRAKVYQTVNKFVKETPI